MTKINRLIKKYIHQKRKSKSILWKKFFEIRDYNFRAKIDDVRSKIDEYKWLHHSNITSKYKDTLYRGFEAVLKTKKMKCNPHSNVELHTVSGHFHLTMYLVAIKSLLRFYDDLAVVVHDGDNTFTDKDIQILTKQIKGIRIISKTYADKKMNKILSRFPSTLRYRSRVVNSFELLDNLTLAKTSKVITMNSDVLFLEKPTELIRWAKLKNPPITYVYERRPAMQKEFLKEMKSDFKPHFTFALACVYKDIMNFSIIERAINTSKISKTHPWLLGQCIFPLLLDANLDKYNMNVFNTKKFESSGVFRNGPIFRHYWSSLGTFAELHISDARRVMDEIGYKI